MKKVFEWVKQHKKISIGATVGALVLIVAVAIAVNLISRPEVKTSMGTSESGITRGEWIKLYGEQFSLVNYEHSDSFYPDVSSDDAVFGYVQTLVENGIMSGEGNANLDERITVEEALIQLARYYGDNYIQGMLNKDELTDADRIAFLKKNVLNSAGDISKTMSEEEAKSLLGLVWNHYLNRQFRNVSEIDYTEAVVDLSSVTEYKYVNDQLTVNTDKEIKEGSILVLGECDEYIAGLAVKVSKVSKKNGVYVLEVTTPEIDEIVDSFYLETSQLFDFEGFEPEEGVTIEEIGVETLSQSNGKVNNVNYAVSNLANSSFDSDRNGTFLKLTVNLTKGKISTTATWNEIGADLELSKAELFQYVVNEEGKLISKYDESGYAVKGTLTLKDLVLNGQVDYNGDEKSLKYDLNAGIKVQPSLSLEGNVKGKQIKIGSKKIHLCFGFSARVDIYICVDFKGSISIKPEFAGLVNVRNEGKSVNVTGKCDSDFNAEIKCEARVKAGPDVVVSFLGITDILDVYAYLGCGADVSYNVNNPLKVVADVYAPTLEAGVSDAENTVLKRMGIKAKIKIIDKEKALFKCPFIVQYTYDVLSKEFNHSQQQETTEASSENTTETASEEIKNTETGNATESGESNGGNTESSTQPPEEQSYTKYKLSGKSYEYAMGFGTNTYIIKENGLYGVIDFDGNVIIPIIYEDVNSVGNHEYEFVKDNVGYVYNFDSCQLLFSYNKIELISNPDDYIETYTQEDGTVETLELDDERWRDGYYRIERQYKKGMMLEIIPFQYAEYSICKRDKFTFRKGNSNTVITSGWGQDYIRPEEGGWWNGIAFSNLTEDNTAVAIQWDPLDGKTCINVISLNGVTKKEVDDDVVPGGRYAYNNGWLKGFDYCKKVINCYTGQIYEMPYDRILSYETSYYYGRNEYYGVSLDDGNTYDLCKGSSILSGGYTFLNFSNDKYIIAGTASGECVFMDYAGNIKATYKKSSVIGSNGLALVSDGIGCFYIDGNLNKVSDYIYKGEVDSCAVKTVKIGNRYYLIAQ